MSSIHDEETDHGDSPGDTVVTSIKELMKSVNAPPTAPTASAAKAAVAPVREEVTLMSPVVTRALRVAVSANDRGGAVRILAANDALRGGEAEAWLMPTSAAIDLAELLSPGKSPRR